MLTTTFPTHVSREVLQAWTDFAKAEETVGAALVDLGDDTNKWIHFFIAYVNWSSRFVNGVAALSSFIGEQKILFKDPHAPAIVADRSNYIASFVFDAARDGYHTPTRSHHCLGQATIMGAAEFFGIELTSLSEPQWLHSFGNSVLAGYTGVNALNTDAPNANPLPGELLHSVFQGIGYHLGSEILAIRECSTIDAYLRKQKSNLVNHLLQYTTTLSGNLHRGYAWIDLNDTQRTDMDHEHFNHALKGVNEALSFIPVHLTEECMLAMRHGFLRFAHDHAHFFQRAGQVTE